MTTKNFSSFYPHFDLQGMTVKRSIDNSKAQFVSRNKGIASSFYLTQPNGSNLLSRQLVSSMNFYQRKKLRNSKSCTKGMHFKSQDKSNFSPVTNQSWLKAVYDPHQTNQYKIILSSSKKVMAKKKVSLKEVMDKYGMKGNSSSCKNNLYYSRQNQSASNRKVLNSTIMERSMSSMKGERNFETNGEAETVTNTTTAKYKENTIEYLENALLFNLMSNLKMAEKDNDKSELDQLLTKRFVIVNETFNGILSNKCKFKNVLKQIQVQFQKLFLDYNEEYKNSKEKCKEIQVELVTCKDQLGVLNTEKNSLIKEIEEKRNVLDKQKTLVSKLENDVKNIKRQAQEKVKKITKDLGILYKENTRLTKTSKELYKELCKYKKEQELLKTLLKQDKDYTSKEKPYERRILEIGKNKVKVPTLDFTKFSSRKSTRLEIVEYYKEDNSDPEAYNSSEGTLVLGKVDFAGEELHDDSDFPCEYIEEYSNRDRCVIKTN